MKDLRETVLAVALLAKLVKRDGTRLKAVGTGDVLQIFRLIDQKRLSVRADQTQCTVSLVVGRSPDITKISVRIRANRLDDLLVKIREASKQIAVVIEKTCSYPNGLAAEKVVQTLTGKDVQIVVDELRSKTRKFDLLVEDASIHQK